MQIGIGLPNPVPDTEGTTLVEWARRAEAAGFSSLATIDRIVYPSYDSLISLAAAAAVTERIGLATNILIAPLRDEVLLAKEAASVDRLSGGRLTLGLAVGGRRDDYAAVGNGFHTRGSRLDQQIEVMGRVWRGEHLSDTGQPSVPLPGREVPILIGGATDNAVERTVKYGVGYTAGGGGPDMMAAIAEKVRKSWTESGREGEPRMVALSYFALGPNADEGASRYLKDYYGFLGEWADRIAESAPTTPDALTGLTKRFEDFGVDELILDPTISELDQIDRAADALL
jgi:alkanesulfonate monooxygenase SsuD/methylene tetrahydromethanopterin reductase-like flavin-dependent oxidoreductase (luciferase family)